MAKAYLKELVLFPSHCQVWTCIDGDRNALGMASYVLAVTTKRFVVTAHPPCNQNVHRRKL